MLLLYPTMHTLADVHPLTETATYWMIKNSPTHANKDDLHHDERQGVSNTFVRMLESALAL